MSISYNCMVDGSHNTICYKYIFLNPPRTREIMRHVAEHV